MAENITAVTDATFQSEVLESDKPVLVDFWAPWCGPCRLLEPILDELATERDDIKIVKINTDENQQTAASFQIMSIPTMLVFKGGKVVRQIVGAVPKQRLLEEIEPALA